jgi:serine phosphatase RsbU (regulator of sigma subunit)
VVRSSAGGGDGLIPLRPTGAAIGLAEHAAFTGAEAELAEGDQLVLYTDGFVEAITERRDEYGDERFRAFLSRSRALAPANLIRGLRSDIQSFTGGFPPADDMSILICRRSGG